MIEIDYLDKQKSDKLIQNCSNLKHKTIMLLMLDSGLRVSEAISLRFSNFDFKSKVVKVKSLKKRGDDVWRQIPLSDRLYSCLAEFISKNHRDIKPDLFLFPGMDENTHITRKAVNNFMTKFKNKNTGYDNLHPHALRHTFATHQVCNGTPLHDVKYLLGHTRYDTTTIYTHTPLELLRKRVNATTSEKNTLLKRVKNFISPPKKQSLINLSYDTNNFIIGRNTELTRVVELVNKNCNLILIGGIGTGKSHILSQITPNKKTLRIDDCSDIKKTLLQMLLYLFKNDKETLAELLFPNYDLNKIEQKLQKDSIKSLCEKVIQITVKHEYVIIIDSVDRITPKTVTALEFLKDHFTIVCSAREIPINKQSFLWNFEIIRIEPLSRHHSLELIHKLAYDLDIEDNELFRNHIYEQSGGNPRVICELIERYRKEPIVTADVVRNIRHTGALKEIDMTFVVLIGLSCVAMLRYVANEVGNDSFKFIGGAAMLLLLVSRYLFAFTKRKLV